MIKTEMLRVFVEVARGKSIAAAAEAIGRAPSAVSMTLKSLEEHLGRSLFETERKSRLTPLGAFVLELAERELAHVARTRAALADFANARIGEVRMACVPSFAVALLPELVRDFLRVSPGVRFDIRDLDSGAIRRELERERIDIGILSDQAPDPTLRRARLATDLYGLVLREDDPLAARSTLRWADLEGVELIANPLCDRLDMAGLAAALAASRLRIRNTTTLLAAVRAGLGVTVLPELVCRHPLPGIRFRRLEDPVSARSIDLVWPAAHTPSPATQAFIDFLRSSPADWTGA